MAAILAHFDRMSVADHVGDWLKVDSRWWQFVAIRGSWGVLEDEDGATHQLDLPTMRRLFDGQARRAR